MTFIIVTVVAIAFGLGALMGAPYLPILRGQRQDLLDLANLQPGQTIIDLGSGDGRLLRAAAARGLNAIGYEINPFLVVVSWIVCFPYRRRVKIYLADMWHTPLPPADAIYVFLIDRYMTKLSRKLHTEVKQPTLVISYVFEIPSETPIRQNHNTHIYKFGQQLK